MREFDVVTGAGGHRLRMCAWDAPTSSLPPLLILHGFLEQGAAWHEVARRLGRPVYAPDHRGHGLSAHIEPGGCYHFWDYVADTDQLVDHLGGEVDLVGHSMGGTIASLLAACRPDKIRRLVLIEGLGPPDMRAVALPRATAFLDARNTPPRHPSFSSIEEAAGRMLRFNPQLPKATAHRLAARLMRPAAVDDPHVRPPVAAGAFTWTWDPLHRGRNPVPFNADLHLDYLRAIRAPTLLVDGSVSRFRLDPTDHARRVAALADAHTEVIHGAGHLVHHDAPEALTIALRQHLG
jgi:pimeloyl-ACP methyl ester carboxylesterase